MTRPAAVLFDCDGVIPDSKGPTLTLLLQDLAAHGLPLTLHELQTRFIGGMIKTVVTRARAAGAQLPEGRVPNFHARMYAMLEHEDP
jgi:beta-phosphoglucomutase-like phosphatase (HAD superfamily)